MSRADANDLITRAKACDSSFHYAKHRKTGKSGERYSAYCGITSFAQLDEMRRAEMTFSDGTVGPVMAKGDLAFDVSRGLCLFNRLGEIRGQQSPKTKSPQGAKKKRPKRENPETITPGSDSVLSTGQEVGGGVG